MRRQSRSLLLALLLLLPGAAFAEVAVLVHGYLGEAESWEKSGVVPILETYGWTYHGTLLSSLNGEVLGPISTSYPAPKHSLYTVELPYKAPLDIQADMLQNILDSIAFYHVGEPITLVGHSAGGLVARLALVKYGRGNVKRLITIATPHLGTPRAIQALDAVSSSGPFDFVKSFFGGADYRLVKSSKQLLRQLVPSRPYNYLYGLNLSPHPDIDYISIIRTNPVGQSGDILVPGFSQNMNNVPALAGRSRVLYSSAIHQLVPKDGVTLAILLNEMALDDPVTVSAKSTESNTTDENL